MTLTLKEKLKSNQPCFGVFCSIPHAVVIEQLALAGYDFVIVDLEHTLITNSQIETALLAARASQLDVLVRICSRRLDYIAPLLDAGAAGIIVANIESKTQAEQIIQAAYYAPEGRRGLNSTRFNGYATKDLPKSVVQANQSIVVIAMIESQQGVEAANDIAATNGIDALLEGAADLSQSLGVCWQTSHPSVQQALKKVRQACALTGCEYIALPRELDAIRHWRAHQVTNFLVGDDRSIMRRAHKQQLTAFTEEFCYDN